MVPNSGVFLQLKFERINFIVVLHCFSFFLPIFPIVEIYFVDVQFHLEASGNGKQMWRARENDICWLLRLLPVLQNCFPN